MSNGSSTLDTEEAHDALVKYISSLREALDGPYDEYCQPEEKNQLLQTIANTELWLTTEEPEFMTPSTCEEHHSIIFSLGERIVDRHREAHEVPQAAERLREVIEMLIALAVENGGDGNELPTLEHGTATLEWLDEQLAKQAQLARNVDPVLRVKDIADKLSDMLLISTLAINGQNRQDEDMHQQIAWLRQLVQRMPDDDPSRSDNAYLLGRSLEYQSNELGVVDNMNEAVTWFDEAVRLTPDSHPDKVVRLTQLGNLLTRRFELHGEIADIHKAISSLTNAVHLTLDDDQRKPGALNNLGNSLARRFERLGDLSDISSAISNQEDAVQLLPDGHADKVTCITNLGASLLTRFERLGDMTDIGKAISYQENAARSIPDDHPNKPACLNNLGNSLVRRFERTGDIGDVSRAISVQRDVVRIVTHDHPAKAGYLSNLGSLLTRRFERLGDITDIDDSISFQAEAVRIVPNGHPYKPACLSNLGGSFMRRFERLGAIEDIHMAISTQRDAVCFTPECHPDKPQRFNNLGNSLMRRFERLGDISDINSAIVVQGDAACILPDGHPYKLTCLSNLGAALMMRFRRLGNTPDIDRAISSQQEAVSNLSDGHPEKPRSISNLGTSFATRFERFGEVSDVDMAISYQKHAVDITPDGHPDKARYISNLGCSLSTRFEKLGDIADLRQSILAYSEAACSMTSPPSLRFPAAVSWSMYAFLDDDPSIYEAYSTALGLLPRLAWLGLSMDVRHQGLLPASLLACGAAATALRMNNPQKALEWLEQGRSIVWSQMLQLRTPLDDLRRIDSKLADKLEQLSVLLEYGSSQGSTETAHPTAYPTTSAEQVAHKYRRLVAEWEESVERARKLPGFECFLRPKPYSELREAASAGPVVVLNISQLRCDALILVSSSEAPRHIVLDRFSYERAQALQGSLRNLLSSLWLRERGEERHGGPIILGKLNKDDIFRALLAELWTSIVEPVLNCLSFERPASGTDPRRIWWCPTGPLAFLPLHAAGLYPTDGKEPGVSLADFAISSYTPTLTALITALKASKTTPQQNFQLLAVIQPSTPGASRLPGTEEELRRIQKHVSDLSIVKLEQTKATTTTVLSGMKECPWVHLACHGVQDIGHPTKSGLLLEDGRLELSQIVSQPLPHAEFAFLSACQTATGDEERPDEAIHLAAGMLLAGYRSVIATMWSIGDNDAPFVADEVYARMIKDKNPSSTMAANALHMATQRLRQRYENRSFASWVPFIHVGV